MEWEERRKPAIKVQAEKGWSLDNKKEWFVICMCVCVCVCVYTHVCIYIHTHTYKLSIFDYGESSLLCVAFLQLWRVGATLQLRYTGFSLRWLLLLRSMGSRCASFSSCGAQVQFWHHGMWDLPGPGIDPGSPTLAGRLSTTGPPGKSHINSLAFFFFWSHCVSCGILVPLPGWNLSSLQWKHGVLTTRLPGKRLDNPPFIAFSSWTHFPSPLQMFSFTSPINCCSCFWTHLALNFQRNVN